MKRFALCIGNNDYEFLGGLSCAVNDASCVAEKLSSLGFDVELRTNLKRDELCTVIVSISDKLELYDAVLLYYAGHGFQLDNGENVLVPIDFNPYDEPKTASYRSFPIEDLMKLLDVDVTKTKIIILDACRSELKIRGTRKDFAPIVAPQGSIIAFSTSPGQTSAENQEHGLYTEALLKNIDLPRKSIESVFKRVRTELAQKTNGMQIPWEHTSLIGEFYINPDTIYSGTAYSSDAYADKNFLFSRDSKIGEVVKDLKSYNYYTQRDAISKLKSIEYIDMSADELFVLGRNIYQAACGGCWDCQSFIMNLSNNKNVPEQAKVHIINGMLYEIYYDSEGTIRNNFKADYSVEVICLAETEKFYGCCEFINSKLVKDEDKIFYLPGQNEKLDVIVRLKRVEQGIAVVDIEIKGESHYYKKYSGDKVDLDNDDFVMCGKSQFEFNLLHKIAISNGYANIIYDGVKVKRDDKILVPLIGYQLVSNIDESERE